MKMIIHKVKPYLSGFNNKAVSNIGNEAINMNPQVST